MKTVNEPNPFTAFRLTLANISVQIILGRRLGFPSRTPVKFRVNGQESRRLIDYDNILVLMKNLKREALFHDAVNQQFTDRILSSTCFSPYVEIAALNITSQGRWAFDLRLSILESLFHQTARRPPGNAS